MRFGYEDAEKYGGNGSGGAFFSLKNDGDIAQVQLLGDDMNDFVGYSVHKVSVGDKDRYVNCLREAGDPIDVCPFCVDKKKVVAKMFVPLYNRDAEEVQVWERGRTFFRDLSSYCSRNPKVSHIITEIERKGKPHDTNTSYGLYNVGEADTSKEDYEAPEILGRYVLDKTAEDMEYYIEHHRFPSDDSSEDEVRPRRSDNQTTRRTARSSRRAEEDF